MITFSTVGDTERAAPSTVRLKALWGNSPTVHLLLDEHEGDGVELGFLYQGGTFAPLGWKEVWNSQLTGEVAVNAVFAGERSFVPGSHTPMRVGLKYSTGFLRCANGNLALRPDRVGCYVTNVTETSAKVLVMYHHVSKYIKSKTDYESAKVAAIWFYPSRSGKGPYKWSSGSRASFGIKSSRLDTRSYSTLDDLVADYCAVVSRWFDWYTPSMRTFEFKSVSASWISMSTTASPASRQTVIAFLRQHHRWLQDHMRDLEREAIPTLHARSFDQVEKFEGNFLVLLSKLDTFGQSTIKSFLDFAKSPGGAKDLASLWLANRYGDRLSISGVTDLVKAIDQEFLTIRTKTERFIRGNSRTTVPFSDGFFDAIATFGTNIAVTPRDYNGLMKLIRTAYEWDFYPTLANVWDAIPLSFVVDWIGNVGDVFASVDRMAQSHYYDVAMILQSARIEASDPIVPGVQHIYYERRFEHSLQLGVESFKLGLPSFINLIDGAALLCG